MITNPSTIRMMRSAPPTFFAHIIDFFLISFSNFQISADKQHFPIIFSVRFYRDTYQITRPDITIQSIPEKSGFHTTLFAPSDPNFKKSSSRPSKK
jgi:hypothetical protein